jgi:hypothetical protein
MPTYQYQVNVGPYGAELIAGSLTQDQIKYWSKQSNEELLDALIDPDTHQKDVPANAKLSEYSEMDDLLRLWGAWYEERTNLWVTDLKTDTELMGEVLGSLEHSSTDVINHLEFASPAIVIESQEKGQFAVTLELDEPFDASKLVVVGEHFRQGYGVITHVQYDEVEYYIEGSTRGQSFDAFLCN